MTPFLFSQVIRIPLYWVPLLPWQSSQTHKFTTSPFRQGLVSSPDQKEVGETNYRVLLYLTWLRCSTSSIGDRSLTEVCILIQNNTDTLDIGRYIVDTQICKGCKLQLLTSIKTQPCFAVVICGFQFSVSTWSQTCPFHVKTGLQSPPWIRIAVLAAWTRIPPRWVALRVRKNHCENGNTKVRNAIHS